MIRYYVLTISTSNSNCKISNDTGANKRTNNNRSNIGMVVVVVLMIAQVIMVARVLVVIINTTN